MTRWVVTLPRLAVCIYTDQLFVFCFLAFFLLYIKFSCAVLKSVRDDNKFWVPVRTLGPTTRN